MKSIIAIILIILIVLLILWLLRRRSSNYYPGKHETIAQKKENEGNNAYQNDVENPFEKLNENTERSESESFIQEENSTTSTENNNSEEDLRALFYDNKEEKAEAAAQETEEPEDSDEPEKTEEEEKEPEEISRQQEMIPEEPTEDKELNGGSKTAFRSSTKSESKLKNIGDFSRIIAINLETPNNEHDSICNIGITIGDTENRYSTNITVNPEEKVDDIPDGMTEEEILNSPTFRQLWPELSKLFAGSLVIAHNASYDLTILKKVLKAYDLPVPEFSQACTYRMSRKFHPEFDSYKLGSICEVYSIPLDVKNAVSHSDACFDIFCRLVEEGQPVFAEAKKFEL